MTKWERVFKSHRPDARIEKGWATYYVYQGPNLKGANWCGSGATPAKAWRDACMALDITAEAQP